MNASRRALKLFLCVCALLAVALISGDAWARERGGKKREEKAKSEAPKGKKKPRVREADIDSIRKRYKKIAGLHDDVVELRDEVAELLRETDERKMRRNKRKLEQLEGKIGSTRSKLQREVDKALKPHEKKLKELKAEEAKLNARIEKIEAQGKKATRLSHEVAGLWGGLSRTERTVNALNAMNVFPGDE
ncbi:MAG: hypothetical protein HN742_05035 [Lentisphaerae bacterium]|jgi:DNA repair exonuclease SbcCD ATPase subunit|nr:hypothetical protein [Lentisphaerota bacterium]MBT4819826.1 hypothetical protein [Lentisphaerota bacterium]MBT5610818.1 hypothetical protein [Lentisphaerota bacterium]MBT7053750.1 hypothetical protein [Lentisphaerota bacterium]MBT7841211.1 hypothetical protein [Lentisphaerota bacterium]